MFTGSTSSPTFLNGSPSVTDGSLAPNVTLVAGTNTVQFVTNSQHDTYTGINLFFDGNLTTPVISAVVGNNVSPGVLYSVGSGITTWGEGANAFGANSFSYTTGGVTITLTGLTLLSPPSTYDLVGNFKTGPDSNYDNFGTITLVVTAVPEPGTFATITGIVGLVFVACAKRKKSAR